MKVICSSIESDRIIDSCLIRVRTVISKNNDVLFKHVSESRCYNDLAVINYLEWHIAELEGKVSSSYDDCSFVTSIYIVSNNQENLVASFSSDEAVDRDNSLQSKATDILLSFNLNNRSSIASYLNELRAHIHKCFRSNPDLYKDYISSENIAFCIWGYVYRELRHAIQSRRKSLGIEIEQHIYLHLCISDEYEFSPIIEAICNYASAIKVACLVDEIIIDKLDEDVYNNDKFIEFSSDSIKKITNDYKYNKDIRIYFSIDIV